MHKLERGEAPICLGKFKHVQHTWDELTPQDREEIWVALEAMQGQCCAYCECDISNGRRHIEHFRQKAGHRYPQGAFEWVNLFGSCIHPTRCGSHKDKLGEYSHEDLIKPDEEDPESFFIFMRDGTIRLRNLSTSDERRAQETLRIFNLDEKRGRLRQMRESAVYGYIQIANEILELAEICPDKEWRQYLDGELDKIKSLPFATAIKHTLTNQNRL
ncbi:MAG: retron Ec78 anti-phage system effector HNH endonuclease PtuB [Candidatus Methylumidiphilus sp.]